MPQNNFAEYNPQQQLAAANAMLRQHGLPINADNLNRAMLALYTNTQLQPPAPTNAIERSIQRTERQLPLPPPSPPEEEARPSEGQATPGFFEQLYRSQAPSSWRDLLDFLIPPGLRAAAPVVAPAVRMATPALTQSVTRPSFGGAPGGVAALPRPTPTLPGPAGAAAQPNVAATQPNVPDPNFLQRFTRLFSQQQPRDTSPPRVQNRTSRPRARRQTGRSND